jgi:hypothetical protein
MRALVTAGAGVLTRRMARRLAGRDRSGAEQAGAFRALARPLARAGHWREMGMEGGASYEQFRARLPLCTYESLAPEIDRMKQGAADVLWPGRCTLYALSSGTTAGPTKYLPVTPAMLRHFRRAGLASLLWYTARAGHARVFAGKHLMLGGATDLAPIPGSAPFPAVAGDLSGIAALHLPAWVERNLYEPGAAIARMSDWPAKIEAMVERTRGLDITLLAGIPSWLLIFADALRRRAGRPGASLREIWPNLECLVHGGVPLGPFEEELRAALGPGVAFHEVYPASEAFVAAQDAEAGAGLRLATGAGVFYEFLPMADYDEAALTSLGLKAVPLAGVRAGGEYALVLTSPAGLARYVLGDVVRFHSVSPPRLSYVGRTRLQLSAFGEHVIERELTDALLAACAGTPIANFHVAPAFGQGAGERGRHEWWIELRGAVASGEALARELDRELRRRNADYDAKRRGGGLEEPIVRLARPGLFEAWLKAAGKWGGQSKTPRCRSDRRVADQLAALADAGPRADFVLPRGI